MLGGWNRFTRVNTNAHRLETCSLVYLDQVEETGPPDSLKLSFTREGWLQPWVRLRNNENEERSRLENMPGFQILNRVRGTKPGASVVAQVSDGKTQQPALVVQRFGNGRTAALTVGDFWRWGLKEESTQRDMGRAWRQLARWLVSDVPNRVELAAEPNKNNPDGSITIQTRVRDKKFQPLDNASVVVTIRPVGNGAKAGHTNGSTNELRLTAEPVLNEAGLYETTFVPREAGGYRAETTVMDSAGAAVGYAQAGWASDPAADEFRTLKPNRALLEEIAKKTGGEMVSMEKLDVFAAQLPYKQVPITENWTTPFWHQPFISFSPLPVSRPSGVCAGGRAFSKPAAHPSRAAYLPGLNSIADFFAAAMFSLLKVSSTSLRNLSASEIWFCLASKSHL